MNIKFLNEGGIGPYSRHTFDTECPGEWLSERKITPCESGYHYTTGRDAIRWIYAEAYEIDVRGRQDLGDKYVATSIRFVRRLLWDEQRARLFACDCVESALLLPESLRGPSCRHTRQMIDTARHFAVGNATRAELDATFDVGEREGRVGAAWAVTWNSPWVAARHASWYVSWFRVRDAANQLLIAYLLDEEIENARNNLHNMCRTLGKKTENG